MTVVSLYAIHLREWIGGKLPVAFLTRKCLVSDEILANCNTKPDAMTRAGEPGASCESQSVPTTRCGSVVSSSVDLPLRTTYANGGSAN